MIQSKQKSTDDIQDALLKHSYQHGDEVVPYCNYESVRNTWGSNHIKGVTYKSNTTLHVATGAAFFTTYCGSLAGEIFNDKWQACEQTKGNGLW